MSLDRLNRLLLELGDANDGTDHASQYGLYELPFAGTLQEALGRYFSQMWTSNVPPQPAERWHIRSTPIQDSDDVLRLVARYWFYELRFSPRVEPAESENVISEFMRHLRFVVGDALVFEVHVTPPMWYECMWQDFAFDGGNKKWLLHFGFSD